VRIHSSRAGLLYFCHRDGLSSLSFSLNLPRRKVVQSLVVEPNSQPSDQNLPSGPQTVPPGGREHAYYEELLERHLDGELDPADRLELFEHIEHCDRCREVLEAEEALVDQLARIPRLMPPSDLRARIIEEAVRQREELMQGGLIVGEDDSAPAAHPHPSPRTSITASVFLALSVLFFLFAVDLSAVPGLGPLQSQLRAAARFVWHEAVTFFQQSADTR
jgi:hypothetical protein